MQKSDRIQYILIINVCNLLLMNTLTPDNFIGMQLDKLKETHIIHVNKKKNIPT